MSWFLTILFAILTITHLSEAKHAKKLPSAVVVGTVYCDTCFQLDFDRTSHFISGSFYQVFHTTCKCLLGFQVFKKKNVFFGGLCVFRCNCGSGMQIWHELKAGLQGRGENRQTWRVQSPLAVLGEQTCQEDRRVFCEADKQ